MHNWHRNKRKRNRERERGFISLGSAGRKLAFLGRKGRRVRRGITEFVYVFIYPKGQS